MEEIRILAVQRVQDGESPETVIKALGFTRACIYNWLARYRVQIFGIPRMLISLASMVHSYPMPSQSATPCSIASRILIARSFSANGF